MYYLFKKSSTVPIFKLYTQSCTLYNIDQWFPTFVLFLTPYNLRTLKGRGEGNWGVRDSYYNSVLNLGYYLFLCFWGLKESIAIQGFNSPKLNIFCLT